MIKVTCEVKVYEWNEVPCATEGRSIFVLSRQLDNDKVEIHVGSERIEVVADDLIAAIENATNTKRF